MIERGDLALSSGTIRPPVERGGERVPTHRPDSSLEWGEARQYLERETRREPPRLAAELRPAAEALQSLGIPVIGGVAGYGTRDGLPTLELGLRPPPLTITREGQRDRAEQELARITIPLALRFAAFTDLGFRGLSLTALQAIDRPALRARFPELFAAAEEALDRSATPPPGPPTEEELFRARLNLAIFGEVRRLAACFEQDYRASVGPPIRVTASTGEPCSLTVGDAALSDGAGADLSRNTLRSRIVSSRLHALDRFAEFLKHDAALIRRPR